MLRQGRSAGAEGLLEHRRRQFVAVRLRDELEAVHRLTVGPASQADGCAIDERGELVVDVWISIGVRDSNLVCLVSGRIQECVLMRGSFCGKRCGAIRRY